MVENSRTEAEMKERALFLTRFMSSGCAFVDGRSSLFVAMNATVDLGELGDVVTPHWDVAGENAHDDEDSVITLPTTKVPIVRISGYFYGIQLLVGWILTSMD